VPVCYRGVLPRWRDILLNKEVIRKKHGSLQPRIPIQDNKVEGIPTHATCSSSAEMRCEPINPTQPSPEPPL
jgi:hypothetical protein